MRIDCLTLFPEMFESPLDFSIVKRAQQAGIVEINITDIRDFAEDSYRKVDDKPYGGGPGMVMMPGPVFKAVEHVRGLCPEEPHVVILTPQGKRFEQQDAARFSSKERLVLISGRYEGFDERIKMGLGAELISIGDFVLSGGELAAMVLIDAVTRLLPGALGHEDSCESDSFCEGLLEYPHYTRPADFRGMKVPEVLLSGDHQKIADWRKRQAMERTKAMRPDLWEKFEKEHGL